MTVQSRVTLKTYFQIGDRPTEAQYADLIDSLVSMNDADASIGGNKTFTGSLAAASASIIGSLTAASADVAGNLEAGSVAGTAEHTFVGGLAVSETDASRPAGSFSQVGLARILEAKDNGVATWYAADGGGQVDVPQAGGFAATEGLQGIDNTNSGFNRRRQYIGGMLRNVSEEDGCLNRTFLIAWT